MGDNALSPTFSAKLADDVYAIKDQFGRKGFELKYKNHFNLDKAVLAVGQTGALVILKKPHVMAMFAVGKDKYQGQAFVAFKGTASLYDGLTDLNTGVRASHTGCHVHQGFFYAFDSVLTELREFMKQLKGVHTVHCVGHSLGGAVATLAADWIKNSGKVAQVSLYTFGSPRVGLEMFAGQCTTRLKQENIYRIYHRTDPVPMVPTWPFFHVPASDADCFLESPLSAVPWQYHLMGTYITSAEKVGKWDDIKSNRPKGPLDASVERWLQSDGVLSLTASTLELLNAALLYVLKKAMNAAGILIISSFATTFTLLDRMAMFIAKAADVSKDLSIWVYHLVKKMAALVGVTIKKGADLTVEFIRMVFLRLHQRIADMVGHISRKLG